MTKTKVQQQEIAERRKRKATHTHVFRDLLQLTKKSVKILHNQLSKLHTGLDLYSAPSLYVDLDKEISKLKKEAILHKSKNVIRVQIVKIVFKEPVRTADLELLLLYHSGTGYLSRKWLSGEACIPSKQDILNEIEQFQTCLKLPIDRVILTKQMLTKVTNQWDMNVDSQPQRVSVIQLDEYGNVSTYYPSDNRNQFKHHVDQVVTSYQKTLGQHLLKQRMQFKPKKHQLSIKQLQKTYNLPSDLMMLLTDKDYAAPFTFPADVVAYLKDIPLAPHCDWIDWGDVAKLRLLLQRKFGHDIANRFLNRIDDMAMLRTAIYLK